MKKTLVIGSSVCDIILRIHHIPKQCEDENILSQNFHIGGCAFNVANILNYFDMPFTLLSPIGKGIYGDFVKKQFIANDIPIMIETNEENGCCYCLVDDSGERTFLCKHGAEYLFQSEWFERIHPLDYQQVYICGLEIEEKSGPIIVNFLEQHPHLQIFFAPGPRISHICQSLMHRLFCLHPIVHLNQQELLQYTKKNDIEQAAITLYQQTNQTIIVTLGKEGCYFYDGNHHYIKGNPTNVVDTIGAGDSHIGTILAFQAMQQDWSKTIQQANYIASLVVSQTGAYLSKENLE